MYRKVKRHILLVLAALCLIAGLGISLKDNSNTSSNTRKLNQIQENVNNALEEMHADVERVLGILRNDELDPIRDFSKILAIDLNHACLVYKNEVLVYWTENRIAPPFDVLESDERTRILDLPNIGSFITYHDHFTKDSIEYAIFSYLPLKHNFSIENEYISSGHNKSILGNGDLTITTDANNGAINLAGGKYLFSVKFNQNIRSLNEAEAVSIIALIVTGGILLLIYLFSVLIRLRKKGWVDISVLLLFLTLLFFRFLMLYFRFPFNYLELDLFNPEFYASSGIAPSLGDLLLNILFFTLFLFYLFENISHTLFSKLLMGLRSVSVRWLVAFLIILLSHFTLYQLYDVMWKINEHSPWIIDINQNIEFPFLKVVCIAIFILLAVNYFLLNHILVRLFMLLVEQATIIKVLGIITFVTTFSLVVINYFGFQFNGIVVINALCFVIVYFFKFPRSLSHFTFTTYIYFFVVGMACASAASYAVNNYEMHRVTRAKEEKATQLLFEQDFFAEFLLQQAADSISNDYHIRNFFLNPLYGKNIIERKIRRVYLDNYFDKYDVKIYIFHASGEKIGGDELTTNYGTLVHNYKSSKLKTEYQNVYYFNPEESEESYRYYTFSDIFLNDENEKKTIGHVVLDLSIRQHNDQSVYPKLLVDKKVSKYIQRTEFDYARLDKGVIKYKQGPFDYNVFDYNTVTDLLSEQGNPFIYEGYHHYYASDENGSQVIVSSPLPTFIYGFSNFSFFLIILLCFTLLILLVYTLYFSWKRINIDYATKIQVYLNIAFFLPLFIVSITTLSIISTSYKEDIQKTHVNNAKKALVYLKSLLGDGSGNQVQNVILDKEDAINKISQFLGLDINLYDNTGSLIYSNQPKIFYAGMISRRVNPEAYVALKEDNESFLLLSEQIGKLQYNAVYLPISLSQTSAFSGILNITFFESEKELNERIIEVLTTIFNIFTSILILILALSYFASRLLTYPLTVITQKLRKTTLEQNEPLEWNTKDEIGLLVGEYNKMIEKLQESKEALAKSEKESAWRQMARQVAHEIKNPLTPMKLTLQQLQRAFNEDKKKFSDNAEKSFKTLLDQIENLDDIATSFSSFAQMPIPKNERFELSPVIKSTVRLYNNHDEVNVKTVLEDGQFFVIGDQKLLSRILTNLILNGLQSVPEGKTPEVGVYLTKKDVGNVLIEVRDNGTGIPENIRQKVFVPNFSTKYAGSGIGLAVAKRGIEHAKGKIWFETEENKGTSFFIELPLVD